MESDIPHWSRMRDALWPGSAATNPIEIEQYFSDQPGQIKACFLVIENEKPVGFIELNIRGYAEGSMQTEVPYVEGWYIDSGYRGQGLGKRLMEAAEHWARQQGYAELASDAELHNTNSIAAHQKLGFTETDRLVCFLKKLN